MSPISPELLARARDWAASDPDPATAAELDALLEAAVLEDADADAAVIAQARQELADAFSGTCNSAPQDCVPPWDLAPIG